MVHYTLATEHIERPDKRLNASSMQELAIIASNLMYA